MSFTLPPVFVASILQLFHSVLDGARDLLPGCGKRGTVEIGALQPEFAGHAGPDRSEEHKSDLQSLMRISYAVFCLKTKNTRLIRTNRYAPLLRNLHHCCQ